MVRMEGLVFGELTSKRSQGGEVEGIETDFKLKSDGWTEKKLM